MMLFNCLPHQKVELISRFYLSEKAFVGREELVNGESGESGESGECG